MSIQSEIDRINQAKTDLAAAIESKGVTVPPNTTINVYPGLVQQIEQGAGLPSGGTPGQMLYQGESGPEWGDKPVMGVNVSGDQISGWTADKTFGEIRDAYDSGYSIFMKCQVPYAADTTLPVLLPLFYIDNSSQAAVFASAAINSGVGWYGLITSSFISIQTDNLSGQKVTFTPGTTGLTSTNVQDAIEEVNEKIPSAPKSVAVTLSSTGWSSNTQTVTVQGVKTSGQSVRISPATKTDADNWVAAGVWCSEPTTANQLVFTCDTAPTENININVELQEVQS